MPSLPLCDKRALASKEARRAITRPGKSRIMIFGPNVVEFRTADGEALAISIRRSEAHVIRHFDVAPATGSPEAVS